MKLILALLACISVNTYAGVYKWVDADGKVHYGDRPNRGSAQELDIKSAPTPAGGTDATKHNQQNIESWLKARDQERKINQRKEAELKRQKDIQRKRCAQLKVELTDLQRGGVWYDLDETGQRRYYSDSDIASEIDELKEIIRRDCPR